MLTVKALLESSEPLILPFLSIVLEQGFDDSTKGGSFTNDEWFRNDVQMILKTKIPPPQKKALLAGWYCASYGASPKLWNCPELL